MWSRSRGWSFHEAVFQHLLSGGWRCLRQRQLLTVVTQFVLVENSTFPLSSYVRDPDAFDSLTSLLQSVIQLIPERLIQFL